MNFSHLKNLDVKGKTADFVIYQINGEPTITLKPATEANKPYFNAVLKRSRRNMRAVQSGAINQVMIKENREQDRDLFPRFVVVGWDGILDSDGEPVEFTKENCADFLAALPDWLFDEVRDFAGKSSNFSGEMPDIETKAGN
jgi:hypothetical protein